ncbi:MAG TPA: RNA-guided pseudouridylation complex pseudouridine synthase subunit Cbf5 [Candidatus Norongarragalinales archaeon]|nr:RNA-guided pseudouridylation complex pseudouridine synthase subunit Cbf5 [Candidatus Norongarragalinales archaeon]
MITLQKEKHELGQKPSERTIEELLKWGFVAVDKPQGPTSHEVSAFVKKILNISKTGHTGTLDSNVSGVLPVLLNDAVKAAWWLARSRKKYVCLMRLDKPVSLAQLESEAFSNLRGKIYQKPPLASAVAKKLRVREVFSLDMLEVDEKHVLFETETEAGTYVRNLVFDAGELLGVKSEMTELRRTLAVGVSEDACFTLQELSDRYWLWKEKKQEKSLREVVRPIEELMHLKKIVASDGALKALGHGSPLAIPGVISLDEGIVKEEPVQILSGKGELVAIGKALKSATEISEEEKGLAVKVERVIHAF